MFVDEAHIAVRSGKGGNGIVAFRRDKFSSRGGPNGGDGGRGGSVYVQADPQRTTLIDFRHKHSFAAANGGDGGGDNCHGKDAEDIVLLVPCGTLVYSGGELLADLSEPGARALVAQSGRGGLGNQHFATPTRQTPRFAQKGEPGEERELDLQLKLLADAGIVGAPNAGKSTLLASVSAAHPKIADYPFTTLQPELGVVQIDVDANFVLVDVPGLIEGASLGAGLGDKFLRHVERTRVLIHLVDGGLPPDEALAQMAMIEHELADWSPLLLRKRRIVAVSKQDLPEAAVTLRAVREKAGPEVFGISAASGQGTKALMAAAYDAILSSRADERDASVDAVTVLHPKAKAPTAGVDVLKEGAAFRIVGTKIERLAAMTEFASEDGRAYFEQVLQRSGARRKLEKLGAQPGDTVRVGAVEYTYS
ncbi:MAG TPA: GTPase ObgE [Candidatus Eremiobacteraceae bacterium]|nr:GTPase ObgE [Candidatus Eremiobacteraceae bacterium]